MQKYLVTLLISHIFVEHLVFVCVCVMLAKCGLYVHLLEQEVPDKIDTFCQLDSAATMQDAVMQLYRCVVEIKMKVKVGHTVGVG